MDTSSSNTVDNTELQALILALIQTLEKKYGVEKVFQLVLESSESVLIRNLLTNCEDYSSKIKK